MQRRGGTSRSASSVAKVRRRVCGVRCPIRVVQQLGSLERATLVGRCSPQTRVREGDAIEVAVDEGALHFFDASTGDVITDKAPVPAAV
jgi:hypothetical protein